MPIPNVATQEEMCWCGLLSLRMLVVAGVVCWLFVCVLLCLLMCCVVSSATRLQLSSTSIAPGDSVTVTLSGTIRGFVLYAANAAGAHKGVLTNNANSAACETAPAGSDTGSTIRHKNGNTKQNQQFNWKAPTQPGTTENTHTLSTHTHTHTKHAHTHRQRGRVGETHNSRKDTQE